MNRLTRMPIFRRLFLTFFVAALLQSGLLVGLSWLYLEALYRYGMTQDASRPYVFWTIILTSIALASLTGLGYLPSVPSSKPGMAADGSSKET